MKVEESIYLALKEKLEDYSDESFIYIKNALSENIELSHTILSLVSNLDKPFQICQYSSLINILLRNKDLFSEVFRVFFSKSNLDIENSILFINYLGGETYQKIIDLEDKSDIYTSIASAFFNCKSDDRRYLVIDHSITQFQNMINSLDIIFTPVIKNHLYTVNLPSRKDYYKEVDNILDNDNERRNIYDLWWKSFVCKERLFTLTMGILREEYEALKRDFSKETYDKSFIYHADYTTKLLLNFFVTFNKEHDLSKLDEIAIFCLLYFGLDQDSFSKNYLVSANEDIYTIIIEFLLLNPEAHLEIIINEHKKLKYQKAWKYTIPYKGVEISGGGLSQAGNEFTLHDSLIVEKLLIPFLRKLYEETHDRPQDQNIFLKILEHRFLKDFETNPSNPILLKRATIPLLILELLTLPPKKKTLIKEWLYNIMALTEGIPHCSESIFYHLMHLKNHIKEYSENFDHIFDLIEKDIELYDVKLPTNVFAIQTILLLVRNGHKKAKRLFLKLVKNDAYIKRDDWDYHTFSNLGSLDGYDSSFVLNVINSFLENKEWIASGRGWNINEVVPYLVSLYVSGDDEAKQIESQIIELANQDSKTEAHQKICTNFLSTLAKRDSEKAYSLLIEMLRGKPPWEIFTDYRDDLVSIIDHIITKAKNTEDAIAKEGILDKVFSLIEQFIDDPDPSTDEKDPEFNYHRKIENNEDPGIITSVRGRLCWAVQKLCRDDYSLKKAWEYTNKLLFDPNLYVVYQAIVPFIEIVKRRTSLSSKDQKAIYKNAMYCLENYSQYKAIANHLSHVFSFYRDLNEDTALKVLEHLKHTDQIGFFFIYYAYFRSDLFQDKGVFDGTVIEEKITSIIKNGNEPSIVRDIFSQLSQVVQENVDFFPRIIDPINEYQHNITLDKLVLNQVFRIVFQIIQKDKAKKYYSDAIILYKKYIAIEQAFIDESFEKPEIRESAIYWLDYYHKKILQELFLISKNDFYSCLSEILQIDFTKNVRIDHNSFAKILADEQEVEFLQKAIDCLIILSDFNPHYFEIKKQLESKL